MWKFILFLCSSLLINSSSLACLNYYYALTDEGEIVELGEDWQFGFSIDFDQAAVVRKMTKLEGKLKKEKNFMLLSDYALCLMKLGKAEEARIILSELARHYPGEYQIMANLGTAYELTGQLDSAIKYIERDIALNPHDHEGSEWIHLKILQTKKSLTTDPNYLKTHTVLGLSEVQKQDKKTFNELLIQLQERVPFTPSTSLPDEIMASLLVDLAEVSANVKSIQHAHAYFQIAKKYYHSQLPFLDARIKDMEKLFKKYNGVNANSGNREGDYIKVSMFDYKSLLKQRDDKNFKADWSRLTSDPGALLALVDFTITPTAVRQTEGNTTTGQGDDLKLVKEDDHAAQAASPSSMVSQNQRSEMHSTESQNALGMVWIYIVIAVLSMLMIGFILWKKRN